MRKKIEWSPSIVEKFHKKLSLPDKNGCIIFNGEILCSGYGRMCINYQKIVAHRISWMINFGNIPYGLWVLHKCDIRRCVNPNHLFLGTYRDNIDDKVSKNRQQRGSEVKLANLNEIQVKEIKILLSEKVKQKVIAQKYNVTAGAIWQIKQKLTWKHINA